MLILLVIWRGFDPTHGLAVADWHIALAAAPSAAQTLPVTGSWGGTGGRATLAYHVELTAETEA